MDLASLASGLLDYGAIGILAAIGVWWKVQGDRRVDKLHQECRERETSRDAEFKAFITNRDQEVQKIIATHQTEVRELTNRFVALVERHADHYRGLLDTVSSVIEALPKAIKR